MDIPFYSSLEQKSKSFKHQVIDTKADLDRLISEWEKKDDGKEFIFRGVNNAKFKLYNSGQRAWIGQELAIHGKTYQSFIQDEINYAKNFQNSLLIKFFKAFGHTAYDFSILSFLQHYKAPTPLLDFSYSFDCTLFFCLDEMSHYPSRNIENYFSMYAIDTSQHEFISFLHHLQSQTDGIESLLSKNRQYNIDAEEVLSNISELNYQHFEKLRLFYLPGYSGEGSSFQIPSWPGFKLVYNQHNLNIINQEGLFVFNSDPTHPLEDYFTGNDFTSYNKTFLLDKIHCWDIHKSLNEYLADYLKDKNITKDFIYPQEEFIASSAFKSFKKNI